MKKAFLFLSAAAMFLSSQVQAEAPMQLPFHETFPDTINWDDPEDPESRWFFINKKNNGYMYDWMVYRSAGFDGVQGYAQCPGHYMQGVDNYLVTKPIHLEKGATNLNFYYRGGASGDLIHVMDVIIGKDTTNIAEWKPLIELENVGGTQWTFVYADFDVVEAGEYHFAFHVKTPASSEWIGVDELIIQSGKYQPVSELGVVYPLLPFGGCTLTNEETVGLRVANTGTKAAEGFSASYQVNGGGLVKEDFTETIEPGDSLTVYFSQKADFSQANTEYIVEMQAASSDQLHQFNDSCSGKVRNLPVKTTPYTVSFAEATGLEVFWYPNDIYETGWSFDYKGRYKPFFSDSIPLVSGCFALEGTKYYRLTCTLSAGSWGWPENNTSAIKVLMGESGTSVDDWKVIALGDSLYLEEEDWNAIFHVQEAGTYSLAIVSNRGQRDLMLHGITLEEVAAHDVAVVATTPSAYPRLLPLAQLEDASVAVTVENRGNEAETVTLQAVQGEEVIAQSDPLPVESQKTLTHTLALPFKNVAVGADIAFEVKAVIDGEDAVPADNAKVFSFTVSDKEYAYDNITDFTRSIGDKQHDCGYGRVFDIQVQDTLTAVSIAFDQQEKEIPFTLKIYEVNDHNIARLIWEKDLKRAADAGFQPFEVSPLVFGKGRYFIEVVQEWAQYMGLCYEKNAEGLYHMKADWEYSDIYFDPDSLLEGGNAFMGIRPMFASNAKPLTVDLEAVAHTLPADTNLMITNEPIEVEFCSNGYKPLDNVEFHCLVDGKQVATTTVEHIEAYERSFFVRFEADLTALGKHELTVYPVLEADDVHANDTLRWKVLSIAEADPYKLDFETCTDFATDRLNPTWQSIDRDGGITNGYTVAMFPITWPGWDEPFGFTAFNPLATTPVAPYFFEGYHGRRFGASFFAMDGYTEIANNDWLVSPKLELGENPELRFMIKSQVDNYGLEDYNVWVSVTGTEEADFVMVGNPRQAPVEWENVVVKLDRYKNQSVHVAIQCVSKGKFILLIDDIEVVRNAEQSGIDNTEAAPSLLFVDPMAQTLHIHLGNGITGETMREVMLYDMAGQLLKTVEASSGDCTVSLAGMPAGVYACRILTSTGRVELGKFAVK